MSSPASDPSSDWLGARRRTARINVGPLIVTVAAAGIVSAAGLWSRVAKFMKNSTTLGFKRLRRASSERRASRFGFARLSYCTCVRSPVVRKSTRSPIRGPDAAARRLARRPAKPRPDVTRVIPLAQRLDLERYGIEAFQLLQRGPNSKSFLRPPTPANGVTVLPKADGGCDD